MKLVNLTGGCYTTIDEIIDPTPNAPSIVSPAHEKSSVSSESENAVPAVDNLGLADG
jgi:hypothetical protein